MLATSYLIRNSLLLLQGKDTCIVCIKIEKCRPTAAKHFPTSQRAPPLTPYCISSQVFFIHRYVDILKAKCDYPAHVVLELVFY